MVKLASRPFPLALISAGLMLLSGGVSSAQALLALDPLPQQAPRPLVAEKFCWLAGVDRSPHGVAIYFTEPRTVRVTMPSGEQIERRYDPTVLAGVEHAGSDGPVMFLPLGTRFTMSNSPEDTCTGTVMRTDDGHLSLAMVANFVIDGVADSAEEAIYAQPAGAVVKDEATDQYSFYSAWPEEVAEIAPLKHDFERASAETRKSLMKMVRAQDDDDSDAKAPRTNSLAILETTRVAGNNSRMLSLLTDGYIHFGGAHGMSGYAARLWDRHANAEINPTTQMFSDGMSALRPAWCAALDAQRVSKSDGRWKPEAGKKYNDIWDCPTFDKLAVVPLGEAGQPFDRIRIIAAPYLAGPYSDGDFDVTFPVTASVMALIKPAYRDAFQIYGKFNPR